MTEDFSTIEHGVWDADDWSGCQATFPKLADLELDLHGVASLGPWLLGDAFHSLHKATPQLRTDTHPRAALNRQIAESLLDGQLDGLRKHTVGSPMMSSVALIQIGDTLRQLLVDAQRVQEAADEADAAANAHQDAQDDNAAREAAGDGPDPDVDLDALAAAADRTARALANETAAMGPVVASAVAAGIEAATDAVEKLSAAADGWGVGDEGESGTDDPAARLALLERLADDQMADLAKMVGRLRFDASARVGTRWDTGPGEITTVVPGNNLSRMTAGELANLAVPELRYVFFDRYLRRQLLCLHMEEPQREAAGSIIYLEDASSTMDGQRSRWARAVGYRLLETAVEQRRGFRAIVFAGVGKFKVFDFGDDAATSTVDERLAYAEFTMTGETDFQGPLTSALTFIEDEHDRLGRSHADIVLATDGIADIDDDFQELFDARKAEHGFRCYGIMIQHPVTAVMTKLCDKITSEDRLEDGANIAELFDDLEPALVTP